MVACRQAKLVHMEPNPELATWLMGNRRQIEGILAARLGPAAPRASGPEAETLRRFRTFASTALMRGEAPPPALEGLRPNERRVMALLAAWADSAGELAGPQSKDLQSALAPLLDTFRLSLRTSTGQRHSKGTPRAARRAVAAANDRIADAFLAVDVHEATLVDANPAAGALLGVERDTLLGLELMSFVPSVHQSAWWAQLDRLSEGDDAERFEAVLADAGGTTMRLEASATRLRSRGRTLALVLLRPVLSNRATRPVAPVAAVSATLRAAAPEGGTL